MLPLIYCCDVIIIIIMDTTIVVPIYSFVGAKRGVALPVSGS